MREILFRGKKKDNEKWIDGGYSEFRNFSGEEVYNIIHNGYANEIIPETIGQYTGLTDKNGTNIFEGDIVKGSWNTNFQIYYDDWYLGFRAKDKNGYCNAIDYYGLDKLEVIGNIHDNPELLGGAE